MTTAGGAGGRPCSGAGRRRLNRSRSHLTAHAAAASTDSAAATISAISASSAKDNMQIGHGTPPGLPCQRCPAAIWVGLPPGVLAPLWLGAQTRCRHPATGRSDCFCGSRTKHGGGLGSGGVRALPRTRGRLRCIRRRRGLCRLSAGTLAWQFLRWRGHFLGNVSNRQIVRGGGDGAHGYFLLVVLLRRRAVLVVEVSLPTTGPITPRPRKRPIGQPPATACSSLPPGSREWSAVRAAPGCAAPHPAWCTSVTPQQHGRPAFRLQTQGSPAMLMRFLRRADHRGPAMGRTIGPPSK
jgi:hypothetical protein